MIPRCFPPLCLLLAASGMSCAPRGKLAAGWVDAMTERPKRRVLNVAHRGARSLAPENTLAAGRKAFEVGADAWEIDVHLTRDGRLVVIHDDTLARTTDARRVFPDRSPWYVSDFTLEEIRRLDAGSWFVRDDPFGQIAAGAVAAEACEAFKGERVPTLEEALGLTREMGGWIDVEIKQMPRRYPGIVEKVVAAIEAAGMVDRAAISCFDHSAVIDVKSLNPAIASGPIASNRIGAPHLYIRKVLGGDGYFPSGDVVGMRSVAFAGSKTIEGTFAASEMNLDDLRALRDAGIAVFVWTINDERALRALLEAPITGIVTDFPQTLARLLDE